VALHVQESRCACMHPLVRRTCLFETRRVHTLGLRLVQTGTLRVHYYVFTSLQLPACKGMSIRVGSTWEAWNVAVAMAPWALPPGNSRLDAEGSASDFNFRCISFNSLPSSCSYVDQRTRTDSSGAGQHLIHRILDHSIALDTQYICGTPGPRTTVGFSNATWACWGPC
jgi:hypothetical protein